MRNIYLIALILLALLTMSFRKSNPERIKNLQIIEKSNIEFGTSSFVEKRIFLSSFIWHVYRETVSARSTKEDGSKCEDDTIDPVLTFEYNNCKRIIEKYNK